jgi:hypothetical protein
MRGDCGQLDPGAVIRPVAGEWHPNCQGSSTKMSFRTGTPAVQPSISSVGARLAVAGAYSRRRKKGKAPAGGYRSFQARRPTRGVSIACIKQHRSTIVQVDHSAEPGSTSDRANWPCSTGRRTSTAGLSSRRPHKRPGAASCRRSR